MNDQEFKDWVSGNPVFEVGEWFGWLSFSQELS